MKNLIKLEINKAFKNKFFLITIIIGCLITMLAFGYNIKIYYNDRLNFDKSLEYLEYVFNLWIGGEPFSLGTTIYFFVFPLLIAIPYGWSYCEEKISGYTRLVVIKSNKKNYYLSKYIATFISGGTVMVIPLIFNFWLTMLFVPVYIPDVSGSMYSAVYEGNFLSELYYTVPFLYVALYLLIDFIYCGLLACISMATASFVRYKWITIIVPFILVLTVHYSSDIIYSIWTKYPRQISPLYFLRGCGGGIPDSGLLIFLGAVILFFISGICTYREYRHEIF